MENTLDSLLKDIRQCMVCSAHLPLGPRPIVQAGVRARLVIIGQAPGSRVHSSGIPWDDDSGDRLRAWLGIARNVFYDPAKVALMPMGFCYPGAAKGADLPPRPECAPLWHARLFEEMPDRRLTLLVGGYSQNRYLQNAACGTMTETVRQYFRYLPDYLPLPHPSWRSTGWMRRESWFEAEVLPELKAMVQAVLVAQT